MKRYIDPNTRFDRANAVVWVAAVHLVLAALMTLGTRTKDVASVAPPTTQMIEIAPDNPPPPPPPPQPEAASADQGAAGKRAVATPVVAPEPQLRVETASPLRAARIAGAGAASSTGAARAGQGSGAGGAGDGPGGGGEGSAFGENAQLLSGGLNRRDYRMLRSFSAPEGQAVVALLVGPQGRVERCRIRQSSGDERLDRALCAILAPRMMWAPARDEYGRPLAVGIDYTAVWARF